MNFGLGLQTLLKVVIIARRCLLFWQSRWKLFFVKISKKWQCIYQNTYFWKSKTWWSNKKYWFRFIGVIGTFQKCDTFVTNFLKSNDLQSRIITFGCRGTQNLLKSLIIDGRVVFFLKNVLIPLQRCDSDLPKLWYIRHRFSKKSRPPI